MKRTLSLLTLTALLMSGTFVAAQKPDLPKDMPAPGAMPTNMPCAAEMKAAMKNMPKMTAPTGDAKLTTPPEDTSPEGKALKECLKKNAPKAPTSGTQAAKIQAGGTIPAVKKPTSADTAVVKKQTTPAKAQQCVTITKLLKVSSQDAEVIALKKFLAAEGHLKGVQNTNYFGPATETALKAWQKKKGLTQSGTTDTKTRAALKVCATAAATQKK